MEPNLSCDVCIIGGNIAGSYLAFQLASKGVSVIVVEQNRIPGVPMQCAGIVSQRIRNIVEIDPSLILNRVDTAWLISENGKKVSISIQDNPYILDRMKLDQYFFQKASHAGTIYLLHEKFETFKKNKKFVNICTNKRQISAQIIVGCDGPYSKVAKLHGITHNLIPAIQVLASYKHPLNSVEMYFKENWKDLFGWVIPIGNGLCRIGLGCKKDLKKSFNRFLRELHVESSHILKKYGGQILLGYPKRIAFQRAILLGDAAGMVKATTGGGINTILKASKYAKDAILKAIERKNFSSQFFITHYERSRGIRHLKYNIYLHYLIRIVLKNITLYEYEQSFIILKNPKIKKLLLKYGDMDFPMKFIFNIIMRVDLWIYFFSILRKILSKIPNIIQTMLNTE